MKCNYERLERIRTSTHRIKIMSKTSLKIRRNAEEKDAEELKNIINSEVNPDDLGEKEKDTDESSGDEFDNTD